MSEITLSVHEATIEAAHRIAEENSTTVSAMFERYIRFMDSRRNASTNDKLTIPPITRSLIGIVKLPEGVDDHELVTEALMEKYGLSK